MLNVYEESSIATVCAMLRLGALERSISVTLETHSITGKRQWQLLMVHVCDDNFQLSNRWRRLHRWKVHSYVYIRAGSYWE